MIRLQITSPFRYQFRTSDYDTETKADKMIKDHFLSAGSYYNLDPEKDLAEIKFILSPNFIFKNYIYVDVETIPYNIRKELSLEASFYEEYTLPKDQEYIPSLIEDNVFQDKPSEHYPTLIERKIQEDNSFIEEPQPNLFDKTSTVVKEAVEEKVVDKLEKEKEQGALNTPYIKEVEETSEDTVAIKTSNVSREIRKEELNKLHFMKLKEICEVYNIEYTNKKDAILEVLDLEYGNPNSEINKNIILDNQTEKGNPTNI